MNVSHFYPRSPRGERLRLPVDRLSQKRISIHAPRVGSDPEGCYLRCRFRISIHAPRVGSDDDYKAEVTAKETFLSTLPAWGATRLCCAARFGMGISIHAPRVGSDHGRMCRGPYHGNFYPRSPRGERPCKSCRCLCNRPYFYPRSPRGERLATWCASATTTIFLSTLPAWGATFPPVVGRLTGKLFLSTLPAWGATINPTSRTNLSDYFYPRSPRGERRLFLIGQYLVNSISIHAPRVGSDLNRPAPLANGTNFYPRSPRGERLVGLKLVKANTSISIHAPRVGSDDDRSPVIGSHYSNFYPRSPRGERLSASPLETGPITFLSTLPAWGATSDVADRIRPRVISIHAPRVGSDLEEMTMNIDVTDFYPRSPRGERPSQGSVAGHQIEISIHAPRVGSDSRSGQNINRRHQISIHAPRVGSD